MLRRLLNELCLEAFVVGLPSGLRRVLSRINWHCKRRFGRVDQRIRTDYVTKNSVRKLHLGCGAHQLEGWLNTDYYPKRPGVLHLDATEPFAFEDDSIDYIFSEHMIEHLSYSDGALMLAQCHRVARPGGTIRISTPDFRFLVRLYSDAHDDVQSEYVRWMTAWMQQRCNAAAPYPDAIFIINNFVRDWGHQFIYDEASLQAALEQAGFCDVQRCRLNESQVPELRNLENEKRYPPGFLRLETLTLEAKKP